MADALTPEQINLLRGLPSRGEFFTMNAAPYYVDPVTTPIHRHPDERLRPYVDGTKDGFYRSSLGDVLLATIDSLEAEREGEVKLAGEYQGGYCVDGETQITVAAVTTSEDINNRKAFESLHAGPCEITVRPIKEGGEES